MKGNVIDTRGDLVEKGAEIRVEGIVAEVEIKLLKIEAEITIVNVIGIGSGE